MILEKNVQVEAAGQVQPDQGRLEHPAALGSSGHREHNLHKEEELLGYKYNGNAKNI